MATLRFILIHSPLEIRKSLRGVMKIRNCLSDPLTRQIFEHLLKSAKGFSCLKYLPGRSCLVECACTLDKAVGAPIILLQIDVPGLAIPSADESQDSSLRIWQSDDPGPNMLCDPLDVLHQRYGVCEDTRIYPLQQDVLAACRNLESHRVCMVNVPAAITSGARQFPLHTKRRYYTGEPVLIAHCHNFLGYSPPSTSLVTLCTTRE